MLNRSLPRLLAFLTTLTLLLVSSGCGAKGTEEGSLTLAAGPTDPAEFGSIAPFEFMERRGELVSDADLRGRPWLVGFIFTRCGTICPALTREMSRAHEMLEGVDANIVAITVDPEYDTPEVLSNYAVNFEGGDTDNWLFLRGSIEETDRLVKESFKLALERDPDADPGLYVSHSSLLVAIDADGKVRGYYEGIDRLGTQDAVRRVRYLAGDRGVLSPLPRVNAILNGTAALILILGLVAIRSGRKKLHAFLMRTALAFSAAFLASYLYYHFAVVPAQGGPVLFDGEGMAKTLYLVLLATHVLGAIVNLPMVLRTFWLAHTERWDDHKRLAKRTFPLWLYVSITGVAVYWVLYVA